MKKIEHTFEYIGKHPFIAFLTILAISNIIFWVVRTVLIFHKN